jgi:uncharacterized protein (DUF4415 family)
MNEKEEYNFDSAKQGAIIAISSAKQRITIRIDNDILNWFRKQVHKSGGGNYQTLINSALREYIQEREGTLETTPRKVIREEFQTLAK